MCDVQVVRFSMELLRTCWKNAVDPVSTSSLKFTSTMLLDNEALV